MPSKSSKKTAKKVGKKAVSKGNKKASEKSPCAKCDTELSEKSQCPTSTYQELCNQNVLIKVLAMVLPSRGG